MGGRAARSRVAVLAGVVPALVLASLAGLPAAQASAPPGEPIISPQLSGTTTSTSETITVTKANSGDTLECFYNYEEFNCSKPLVLGPADLVPDAGHAVIATARNSYGETTSFITWWVDTTPPVATIETPSGLSGTATVFLNERSKGVTSQSVRLRLQGGGPVEAAMTCLVTTNWPTSCGSTDVKYVRLTPAEPFVPGDRYVVEVNPSGAKTVADEVGNIVSTTTASFRAPTTLGEASPALGWTWRTVPAAKAKGGSYLVERRKGASVSWAFSGPSVSWTTVVGPAHGRARVLVDGKELAVVSNYAARTKFGVERVFKGLGSGAHTITVEATGRKGAKAGTGSLVAVDAFAAGGSTAHTPDVVAQWQRVSHADSSGGSHAVAELAGQRATLVFRGTSVSWVTATGPGMGQARVLIDGEVVGTVDNYATTPSRQVARTFGGLTDARHTLEVRVLGAKQAASSGTAVVVDGFTIG